jgi:hypothetical protein
MYIHTYIEVCLALSYLCCPFSNTHVRVIRHACIRITVALSCHVSRLWLWREPCRRVLPTIPERLVTTHSMNCPCTSCASQGLSRTTCCVRLRVKFRLSILHHVVLHSFGNRGYYSHRSGAESVRVLQPESLRD